MAGENRVLHVPSAPAASNVRAKSKFLPFVKALLNARSLKLKEWQAGAREVNVLPTFPLVQTNAYQHKRWQGYGHWLGTGTVAHKDQQFLPFKEALLHARSLKLTKPTNARGGKGTGTGWALATPRMVTSSSCRSRRRCCTHVKLKKKKEWKTWCKSDERTANVPAGPDQVYKHDGWQGYGHWLGTGTVAAKSGDQQFLPLKEALLQARSLKLKNKKAWEAWCKAGKRPGNMPSRPDQAYKQDGWQGYGHWLGTGTVAPKNHQFLSFKKALLYARSLKLKNRVEWKAWCKTGARPANMPSTPDRTYKHDGWQGYGAWLGTGAVAPKDQQFLPFTNALLYARSLKLKGSKEWRAWCKSRGRPDNIPAAPEQVYTHDGWQGYGHWRGTANVATFNQKFLPFKKALLYARSLKLKGLKEWEAWKWQGYGHWLGTS